MNSFEKDELLEESCEDDTLSVYNNLTKRLHVPFSASNFKRMGTEKESCKRDNHTNDNSREGTIMKTETSATFDSNKNKKGNC